MGDEQEFDWDRARARASARAQRDSARAAARAQRHTAREARRDQRFRHHAERHADRSDRWREMEILRSYKEAMRLARWEEADRLAAQLKTLREQRVKARKGRKLTGPIAGAILMVVGGGWLLNELGYMRLPWNALFSLVLITLGVGLIVGAQRARHSALIFLGLALILVLVAMSSISIRVPNFPIEGGVGERVLRPTTLSEFSNYSLGAGQLTVDLTEATLTPGTKQIIARVGVGELLVVVPEGVAVQVNSRAGTGTLEIFGRNVASGSSVQNVFTTEDFTTAESRMSLQLSVGLGQVRVTSSGFDRPV